MMHLFVNALAASAGGGLTYIRNVLPILAVEPQLQVTVALNSALREEFRESGSVHLLALDAPVSAVRRFWYEQSSLPRLIRQSRAEVLLSTGNIALRKSPVPQILLSRNSIYTSVDFYRDLRSRGEYREWVDTRVRAILAKRSVAWADVTVAPSEAFAAELRRWTGARVAAIHHGFDRERFTSNGIPLPSDVQAKLDDARGALRLLFVSHYNYYRNFETLIRALPLLRKRTGRPVRLILTCELAPGKNPGPYHPEQAASLARQLGVDDMIIELGAIPYRQLHRLYAQADIYVTPAYTETFAHPLVEAMACGVPVVASDLPVHREICADAARYFSTFSPEALAETVAQVAADEKAGARMAAFGKERSRQFSWKTHVDQVLALARQWRAQSNVRRDAGTREAAQAV